MKELQWGSLFVMLGCVVGCSKSPDSVCEHYMGLRKEAKLTTDATAADACKIANTLAGSTTLSLKISRPALPLSASETS